MNMKVSTRLAAGFSILVALLIVITAAGISRISALEQNIEVIVHDREVKVGLAHTIENEVNRQSRAVRTALIASDATVIAGELAKMEDSAPLVAKTVEQLQATIHTEKGNAALNTLTDARNAFKEYEHTLVEMIKTKRIDEGRAYLAKEMLSPQTAYLAAIEAFAKTQADGMAQFADESAAMARSAHELMLSLSVVAVLLSIGIGVLLTKSITRQIGGEPHDAVELAQRVAAGDLGSAIAIRPGDTNSLMARLQEMQLSLANVVSNVRQNAESVATASAQISQGNSDLSQRTEQQASALEETAASMEELGSTVKLNADNARQANQLSLGASAVAVKGGEVVGQVVDTMKGINESSKKIADIISVIDGIAFQTNILALNAAVEAARAGEQGRGFAVVASEVRSLAHRSADAAKEIKSLITASVERVEHGTALVDEAGVTMREVVGAIKRVTDIMGEISSASVEQSAGVAQVGEAVSQMDQATQQNSALVEESAAAAESLKQQAQQLVLSVAVFKLGAESETPAATP
jgi:methyl-accepting chemotaxis protein